MNIKQRIKYLIGAIKCHLKNIKTHESVYIGKNVHIANGKNIVLGADVQIRPYCDIFAAEKFVIGKGTDIGTRNRIAGNIEIGEYVLFGPDNYICSQDHNYADINKPIISQGASDIKNNGHSTLKIGDGSWIGTHVAIIGDVHIGKNCVIGANSVVTKDIPDYSVAVGIPAKIIKQYNFTTNSWEKIN